MFSKWLKIAASGGLSSFQAPVTDLHMFLVHICEHVNDQIMCKGCLVLFTVISFKYSKSVPVNQNRWPDV